MERLRCGLLNKLVICKQVEKNGNSTISLLGLSRSDLKTLIPEYCDRGWQIGSSAALREFEELLRSR
jgi:hypothetical protein